MKDVLVHTDTLRSKVFSYSHNIIYDGANNIVGLKFGGMSGKMGNFRKRLGSLYNLLPQ